MADGGQWLKNFRETELWGESDGQTGWLGKMPQWSVFQQTGEQDGARIPIRYFGSRTVEKGEGWITAMDVGPVEAPAQDPPDEPEWSGTPGGGGRWLQNFRETSLLGGRTGSSDGPTVHQWTVFAQLGQQRGARIPIYHYGGSGAPPRVAWVAALDVGPISQPNPLPQLEIDEPPTIIQRLSPNHSGRRLQTVGCVIHSTRGDAPNVNQEFEGTLNHFGNPASEVSAHIVIAADGTIAEVVDPDLTAWHAGFHNDSFLGIELVQPRPGDEITDAQLRSCAWWLNRMSRRYGFGLTEANLPEHRNTAQGMSKRKSDVDAPYTYARLKSFIDGTA
jgi:hypothetical protein